MEEAKRKADEALQVENERKAAALRESQLQREQEERQAKIEADNKEQLLRLEREAEQRARAAARPLQEPVKNPETTLVHQKKKEEVKEETPVNKGTEGQLNKSKEETVDQTPKKEGLSISTIGMIVGGIAIVGSIILKFTVFKNK